MSDAVIVALVVALGPMLLGLVTLFVNRSNHKSNTTAIVGLEHKINSRLDQLIQQAEAIAHAAGVKQEQDAERARKGRG